MVEAKKNTVWQTVKPFINGGCAGMAATCVIQPIDMVKVRHAGSVRLPGVYPWSLIPSLATSACTDFPIW